MISASSDTYENEKRKAHLINEAHRAFLNRNRPRSGDAEPMGSEVMDPRHAPMPCSALSTLSGPAWCVDVLGWQACRSELAETTKGKGAAGTPAPWIKSRANLLVILWALEQRQRLQRMLYEPQQAANGMRIGYEQTCQPAKPKLSGARPPIGGPSASLRVHACLRMHTLQVHPVNRQSLATGRERMWGRGRRSKQVAERVAPLDPSRHAQHCDCLFPAAEGALG